MTKMCILSEIKWFFFCFLFFVFLKQLVYKVTQQISEGFHIIIFHGKV